MALISIKDLPQSDALDREAMRSIVGGSRSGGRPAKLDEARADSARVVDYPPGFGNARPTSTKPGPSAS